MTQQNLPSIPQQISRLASGIALRQNSLRLAIVVLQSELELIAANAVEIQTLAETLEDAANENR